MSTVFVNVRSWRVFCTVLVGVIENSAQSFAVLNLHIGIGTYQHYHLHFSFSFYNRCGRVFRTSRRHLRRYFYRPHDDPRGMVQLRGAADDGECGDDCAAVGVCDDLSVVCMIVCVVVYNSVW